jgi:hypothetical protein
LFKNLLFTSVSISLSDLSLLSILELSVAVIEKLRVESESKSELDLVSSEISIVSKLELELIKMPFRLLRVVSVFLLMCR